METLAPLDPPAAGVPLNSHQETPPTRSGSVNGDGPASYGGGAYAIDSQPLR